MSALPPGLRPQDPYAVVFGPKANCTLDICPVELSVYGYRPSLAANVIFIVLYVIAAAGHVYLGMRWKMWWFMWCMLAGIVNAVLGYAGRVAMWVNPFRFEAFMIQIICVTTGPVYYCAAIYITIAIAINHLAPTLSRFNPALFYWIFIPCDILSLILQAAGGGLSTSTSGSSQIGIDLALAGMSFQVFTLLLFCAFFADFLARYYRAPEDLKTNRQVSTKRLRLFFGFMGLAILLILARCAFRLAELHNGYRAVDSLVRDEGLFIALEGCFILVAVYCLMVGHPGLVFKGVGKGNGVPETKPSP